MEEIINPDGSKDSPYRTGVTAYADGSLPPVSGVPNLDLPSLGGMVNPAQLPPQNTPTQSQTQTGNEGYNPYQNLMDNVSSILDKATNNNQQGLKDLYLEANRPGLLGSAVRSYLVDNPIGQQNFTGYEDDNEITAKLESLAPEEQHKLALHFADQLRLNTLPRIQADANLSSQFEGNPLLLTKPIKDVGRTVDRIANNLPLQIGSFGAMLGAGAVAGMNSWLDTDDTPDSNAFERFGSSLWQLSQDLATKTQKFIDPTVSIANPTIFDVIYGNTHNMISWGFEFAFGNKLTQGVSGISSLTKYNKTHSALAKLTIEKELASVGVKAASKLVDDFGKFIAQGSRNSIAKFAKLTPKQAKQFTINVGKAFQHQLADLPFDAPALAVMSSGSNHTIMSGLFEDGTKRSTTPEAVLNRFVENTVLDLTAGSLLLGGGKTAVDSILKTVKGVGKSSPTPDDLYRPLPASAPNVQLPKNTAPQTARDVVETAQAVASHDHNNLMRSVESDARVSQDVAKAVGNVLSKEVEATEAKPYIPGVDQEGMNLIFNRNAELDKLKTKLSNPNTTTEEAQKAVKEAEYAINQMNKTAKAILQGNGGAIKRIGKTYVKAEEFTQAIENLVRTNNEGVLPKSMETAEVAQSINYLQEIEDAGKQIKDIEAENKALAKANKLPPPIQPKDVNKLLEYAEQKKLYDNTKQANKAKIKKNKETIKELNEFIVAQNRNYLLRSVSAKQREIQTVLKEGRKVAIENKVVNNLKKANKIIKEFKSGTSSAKTLSQALEEAGIPLKPAGRGVKTENRLYRQTPEDIEKLGELLTDDDLKVLSKKDRRLVASEELNRLSDEQLEMLSKELDRIFDPESDDGGLLGRKLTRFYVKDSIFPASFIDEAGGVVETPRKLVELNDDLPPLYNQLNDLDIKLASGVPIADNTLEVQRQVIVNQITDLLETKVGGYKIDVKKASENFYNDLRLNLPEEHQQLIPTVEADEVAMQTRQNGRLKQSKIQTVRGSEWYSSLPNTKVKVDGEREYTIKGLVNTELNKLPLEKIEKLVTDIESRNAPKPEELVNYLKGLSDEKTTSKKTNGSIKTTNEEATTKTETEANGNTNREESLRLDKNPYGIDERFYTPGYITDNDIDNFVRNLKNTDKTPVQKQAQYQGMMDSILGRLEKAMDSDQQVNFTFMREAVEHVLYKVKGIVDTPDGKTLYTGEYSQVNLALIERILGVEGKNKVLHLLNDSAVSGEDKLIQADAIAVIATRYNNQIRTELTKIQDATGFAEIAKKSDKTGESSLDRLFNAFTRLRAFEQVLTPDLLKITHDMGLYGERLGGITKELEEARKLQLPWREYEQFVGALPNIYLGKADPSILSGVYKDENLYTKISEEMGVQPNTTLSSELKATVISTIQNTNNAYVELKDTTKKILQEMSILERNKSTSNVIMRMANNMADTSLAWSMAKLVVSTKVLALQTTGLFSSYADAMNRFVGGSALELAVGLFGKGVEADNALSTVRTAKVLAGHELLEGFWRLTKIASLAKSGYDALSLGVKRQGHPLTKRHPGDPFIEASIFKKEGNLLTKGYGALSEGANFLIQKSAFPISTIDAFMTLEAIKTNSRNELYLAVTNSDAYKSLPSKERGAYVSMMLDLHNVDESFLGIKGTSIVAPIGESTINLAQDRTFTTPMPEVWGDAIGREGLYRSIGWAVNKTTQWLTGTTIQNVPGVSGVLRQSLPLFTGVLSNFSDAVARNTPGLNLTSSQGLEVVSKLLPTMVGKADANVPIRELANRPEFASKYAHTMGVFVNTAFGLGALAYLGDSTDDDETFEFTTDVVNGMKAIGKSIPFVEIISEGDGEYDTISNTYPRSIASVVIGLPNANLRWNIPIDQIPLGVGWAINIAKGWSDIEKEKIEEIKFANDTGADPGVVGMLNDKYMRKALEVITETVKVPISFLSDVTSSQLDFSQEGFGLNNVPIVKQFREVYDAFTTTNREVDTHQEWWTTRISALSTPLWSQGLSYFVALGNQKPWGGNLTTNKKVIDKLGFKRISSEAGSAIMQLPGKFDIFGNPVQVIPGFSVNNTAGVSPTISMSNQEMSRLTKLIEKADTGERKDIYKTWMKNIQYKPQIGDKRYSPDTLYFQGVNGSWVINGVMRSFRLTGYSDTPGFSQYDGKTYREAIETLVNSKEYQDAPDIHTVGGIITPTQNTKDLDKFNTWAERTVQGKKTKLSLLSNVISLYQMEWDNQFKDAVDEFELIQKDEKGNPGLIPLDAESIPDVEDRTNYGVKPTPYPVATPDQTSFQDDVFKANVKPFNNLNNSKSRL